MAIWATCLSPVLCIPPAKPSQRFKLSAFYRVSPAQNLEDTTNAILGPCSQVLRNWLIEKTTNWDFFVIRSGENVPAKQNVLLWVKITLYLLVWLPRETGEQGAMNFSLREDPKEKDSDVKDECCGHHLWRKQQGSAMGLGFECFLNDSRNISHYRERGASISVYRQCSMI